MVEILGVNTPPAQLLPPCIELVLERYPWLGRYQRPFRVGAALLPGRETGNLGLGVGGAIDFTSGPEWFGPDAALTALSLSVCAEVDHEPTEEWWGGLPTE